MSTTDEARFQAIFRGAHSHHAGCGEDEWLMAPCRLLDGRPAERPVVWSRRNGPWRRSDVLWVGAAPGNAGGLGAGSMGAHGTRIPFGGDIAGGNLDVLLSSVELDRNRTFIAASLNQLPDRGGGEPRVAELARPVGDHPSSVHLLRETILAVAPRMVVALGNVALRTAVPAARLGAGPGRLTLPGLARLDGAGLRRGEAAGWPADELAPDPAFLDAWRTRRRDDAEPPRLLWLLHPSAQNMSPYAAAGTVFHTRMVETVAALREAMACLRGARPAGPRPEPPDTGIYTLPEWRDAVGPRHAELDRLWRERGV